MKLFINILFVVSFSCFALKSKSQVQCDSIKVYNGDFDNVFQFIYQTIDSDSILAIRHCATTNGCNYTFGLLFWKKDNQFHFKLIKRKNGKTRKLDTPNRKLRNHLENFYTQKLYTITNEIKEENITFIDDGPLTLTIFKTEDSCWNFNYILQNAKDPRIEWINRLLVLIKNKTSQNKNYRIE